MGAFARILILSRAYAPPAVPPTIVTTATAFWMNGSFDERVLQESAALVLKLSQEASKQLTLSVVTGDNPT